MAKQGEEKDLLDTCASCPHQCLMCCHNCIYEAYENSYATKLEKDYENTKRNR